MEFRGQFDREIPRGALTEVHGPWGGGKTAWVLRQLGAGCGVESKVALSFARKIAWIEPVLTLYPRAFVGLARRMVFVEAGERAVWAGLEALRSQVFETVVLARTGRWEPQTLGVELRRLQLAAEKAGAAVVLLGDAPLETRSGFVPVALRVRVAEGRAWVERDKRRAAAA